jgi:DNA-binding transcriptional LysR family regulator
MHEMNNPSSTNLNLLVAMEALLAERSVTRAAARLSLSQPAMSHALARLRRQLGDPLLVRGEHGMVPTPRALALAGPLRLGLAQLEQVLASEPHFDPATSRRRFTLASVDYVALTGLRAWVRRQAREAPGISIEVRPLGPRLRDDLESGALDLVLAGVEVEGELGRTPGLKRTRVASEDFLCMLRRGHPAARRRRLDLDTFLSLRHVTVSVEGGACDRHVDVALRERGLTRRIAACVPHFLAAPLLVSATDDVATLPRALGEEASRFVPLALLPPPLALPPGEADLWWHERVDRDPAHRWLRAGLLQAFAPYRGGRRRARDLLTHTT